jgi:predicted cupin superfamily sugar epimerase
MLTADALIETLGLEPLPGEGGFFRRTHVADETLAVGALPERYGRPKPISTAIYYLLSDAPDCFSAMHRLPTDEIYHFYLGDPVELLALGPDGESGRFVLGQDLAAGQRVQLIVPRGVWQGSRLVPGGRVALLGTTMAPGFDPGDLELGGREVLAADYPDRGELIRALTRD